MNRIYKTIPLIDHHRSNISLFSEKFFLFSNVELFHSYLLSHTEFVFHLYNLYTLVIKNLSVLLDKQNTCKLKWVLHKITWKDLEEVLM